MAAAGDHQMIASLFENQCISNAGTDTTGSDDGNFHEWITVSFIRDALKYAMLDRFFVIFF
jgi:hypothetical protein